MIENISPIDTLVTDDQKLDYICRTVDQISGNTAAFDGIFGFSTINTVLALGASIVTIAGILAFFWEYYRRRTSREWQKKIILDLIRHFLVNNAIIEIIRSKSEDMPDTYHPIEGVLGRFATLDSDTDLARFAVNKFNYEKIHNLSLKIRNYNNYVVILDKHLCDSRYPREAKSRELADVFRRSVEISEKLFELCKLQKAELKSEDVHKYIEEEKYCSSEIEKWKRSGQYCEDFRILPRNSFPEHAFYDDKGLTESLNHLIRHHAALIPFVDY